MVKTKDELLIENIVLKSSEQMRKMLKEELSPLKRQVESMDTRLKAVEETVKPFTVFRRKLWQYLIFGLLSIGTIVIVYIEAHRAVREF